MKAILRHGRKAAAWVLIGIFLLTACKAPDNAGLKAESGMESKAENSMENTIENTVENRPAADPVPEIAVSNTALWPGEFFSIAVKASGPQDEIKVVTDLAQQPPPVFYDYRDGKIALLGINCRTKEGKYGYEIQVIRDKNVIARKDFIMDILPKQFEEQRLRVSSSQQAQRSEENLNDDRIYVDRAKSETSPVPLWEGRFLLPVEGRISTDFGMIRYVNDAETGRHTALDISAKTGTPVAAANSGTVKLAMMLKVTGNTVIIDHGCGVFSAYCHLDKINVAEGAGIKKGEILGEVGTTGFSTGPHLHWTVSVGPVYIDPRYLMLRDPMVFIGIELPHS